MYTIFVTVILLVFHAMAIQVVSFNSKDTKEVQSRIQSSFSKHEMAKRVF